MGTSFIQVTFLFFIYNLDRSQTTSVCRYVKAENISVEQLDGSLVMFLENGLSFDAFCGDEVVVLLHGLPTPIAKYSRRSPYIHLDVNICEKHSFQLMVMEHSFPTKVTTSDWIEYEPSPWFNFIDTELPTYKILRDKGLVSIKWWDLVVNNLDYLQCLTYVDFL